MKFLTLLLSLLLLGCAAEEHQDLREWMRDEAKGMRGKVAPLPEITAFPVVAYETETLTPPFAPELDTFEFLAYHELATPAAIRRAILAKLVWGQDMSEVEPYFTRLTAVAGTAGVARSDIVRSLAERRQ